VVANLVQRRDPGAPVAVARERRSAIGAGRGDSPDVAQELAAELAQELEAALAMRRRTWWSRTWCNAEVPARRWRWRGTQVGDRC